jgi:hypothetical protein
MSQASLARPSRPIRAIALVTAVLAATLGGATIASASANGPGYLAVTDWSASALNANVVRLSATVDGNIPMRPDAFIGDNVIVGIGWADLGTGTALVATIHPVLGRDSHQRPDAWHLHTVQLTGGATAPNDFCLVAVSSTPTAGIAIHASTMTVELNAASMPDAGAGPISASAIDAAVGFTVHPGDAGCATGLGVRVRT